MILTFWQFRRLLIHLVKYANGNPLFLNKMSPGTTLMLVMSLGISKYE